MSSPSTYLVTGACGGLGRALCEALLQRGDTVVGTDINMEALETLHKEIEGQGLAGSFKVRELNVCDLEAFENLVDAIADQFGAIDGIFNNAGIMSSGHFENADMQQWKTVIDINFFGVVNGSYCAYKLMKQQGFGRIINVASTAGVTPVLRSTAYAASKHAVVGFSNSLRGEAKEHGVSVHLIIPGLMDTGIFSSALDNDNLSSELMSNSTPLKKLPVRTAVQIVLKGINKSKNEIVFPFANRLIVLMYRLFPNFISSQIMRVQKHQ